MTISVAQIVDQMRQALSLSDPDVDTTIGSPVRKIFDAVGEAIAEADVDQYLLDYQYDIDAKTGGDLDDFVRLFGFSRFPAKRATGMVSFDRSTPAPETIMIPLSTQLSTEGVAPVIVQTTTPALLITGDMTINVPVQTVIGGSAGNVPASSIRRRLTPIEGITSFTNPAALSGGADAEDDDQLRERFKKTVFRGMAGTEHMFLGIALDDESVTHANVIGPSKKFRETIEVVAGNAVSSLPAANIAFVYPDSSVVGPDIDIGSILTPGVHYSFDDVSNPPEIDVIDSANMPDGVYDLEYEYVSTASRNDLSSEITNRIDDYVNGVRSTEASEIVAFVSALLFNTTGGSPLNRTNFLRGDGVTVPVANNFLVPFAFAPVIDPAITDSLLIDGDTYIEDTDFWLVNDITNVGNAPGSLSGIEIKSVANGASFEPTNGDTINLDYLFNAVPRDIELAAKAWRMITTDLKVHSAQAMYLDCHLAIIFDSGYPQATVTPEIEAGLERHIATLGLNGVVQVSDLLEVVSRVDGVDAVRFLTDTDDAVNYAIQRMSPDGSTVITTYDNGGTPKRAIDVIAGDDEYPLFNAVTIKPQAQNTFGPV